MDTEITLDLNKPLFSYSRYEINDHGYGDDFIHRDGDGVNMQVFFDRATGEFVSKGVSISDFTNLVEGKSARDTNAWTRHSLDPKELLPDDISKVEINDGMMAFLKTYKFNVSDEHTGDPIRQVVYDFDFKDADFYSALYGDVGNWPPAVLRGIVDRFAETGTHGLEFYSEYSLPTCYHEIIPYAENKAQPAPDRTLGHKHEVNRDVAQRIQTERTTVNQIREEDTVGDS